QRQAALPDQIAAAEALAAREQADAVVWFSHGRCGHRADATETDALIVQIAQPKTRSVLVRAVGRLSCDRSTAGGRAAEDSAAFEAAAIVVRAALVAVAAGGAIGVVTPAPAPAPAAPSGPRPAVTVGWLWTLDGLTPHGQQGLQALLGFGGDRFALEMGLLATVPAQVTDDFATVSLSRAGLTMGGAVRQPLGDHFVVGGAVHAGAVVQMRTTTPRMAGVSADPASRLASVVVSPEGRFGVIIPGVRGLTIGVALAADYIPHIPVLGYTRDLMTVDQRRPWVVQPRASLNIQLSLP
ncbi:MAG TPA: hypothetical protein VGL59_06850, partial [Polyangia bacterium]